MSNINVEIFVDEQYGEDYICIGSLIVPIEKKDRLVDSLLNERCPEDRKWTWNYADCPYSTICKEEWHRLNGVYIHYRELANGDSIFKKLIYKKWLNFLIENNKYNKEMVYFNLFYIDLNKLDRTYFGDGANISNIYNKFFRTSLHGSLKWFFPDKEIRISSVIHDRGSMEKHPYFNKFNLNKLEEEARGKIKILNRKVSYLHPNHQKHSSEKDMRDAQLLQFIDLIIATASQNIFNTSNDPFKKELAMIIRPLVERLLRNPKNINSSYNYFRKQQIIFFPKYPLSEATITQKDIFGNVQKQYRTDLFHTDVELKMPPYDPHSTTLYDYMEENT